MANVKIFQIGFNKCGTRSMYQFFNKNKIPGMHWAKGTVGRQLRINLTIGRRPFEGYEDYVFYSDLMGPVGQPWFEGQFYFREFYEAYPGALFILNTRNEANWLKSRMRHPDLIGRFRNFYGLKSEKEVEDLWREQWRSHHAKVDAFFADQRDRLLVFDIEKHGGAELAEFVAPHYKCDVSLWGHVGQAPEKQSA